jgi:hypothetical protein
MSTALVLPDPEHDALPAIRSQCREIFDRRNDLIGHLDVKKADAFRRQAGAIEQFVGNREGRDDARRAARILECAVGAALGRSPGRGRPNSARERNYQQIPDDDRVRFRLIHQHREIWEPVLVERGLSRSQVLRLIALRRPSGEVIEQSATIDAMDWRDWLDEQPDCELLLTDPPYATDVENITGFAHAWLPVALQKVRPTGRAYVCIGAYPDELEAYLTAGRAGMTLAQVLVWTYRNTLGPAPSLDYKQNWQAILYFRGPDAARLQAPLMTEQFSVQDLNAPDGRLGDRYHAWQKPDALADRFIRHATNPGDLVLDPFAGTGTFLLAAAKLGRAAAGCDSDPDQVEVCLERGCVRA